MKRLFTIYIISFICSPLFAQQITDGLVASYTFPNGANNLKNQVNANEIATIPSNISWTDYHYVSPGVYDAVLVNVSLAPNAVADRFGNSGQAYEFHEEIAYKINDKLQEPPMEQNVSPFLSIPVDHIANSNYTYSAWIKISAAQDDWGIILGIGTNGGDQVLSLGTSTVNAHTYYFSGEPPTGAGAMSVSATPYPQLGEWVHLASVRSDTSLAIYIIGQLKNYKKMVANYAAIYGFSNPLAIIGCRYDHSYPFTGIIDDIRIYNRALKSSEILKEYQYGSESEYPTITSILPALENKNSNLKIYPNPADNKIVLETEQTNRISSVKILRADGVVVFSQNESMDSEITIVNLSSGVYLIEAIINDVIYRNRFVKK